MSVVRIDVQRLGRDVRHARLQQRMSAAKLADLLGQSATSVERVEGSHPQAHKHSPRADIFAGLCRWLGQPMESYVVTE